MDGRRTYQLHGSPRDSGAKYVGLEIYLRSESDFQWRCDMDGQRVLQKKAGGPPV